MSGADVSNLSHQYQGDFNLFEEVKENTKTISVLAESKWMELREIPILTYATHYSYNCPECSVDPFRRNKNVHLYRAPGSLIKRF